MTDMPLLGLALKSYTVTELVERLRPWKRLGVTIMIAMGLLLGTSEGDKYYPNPFVRTQLIVLACIGVRALIFRPLIYNNTREIDAAAPTIQPVAKAAAILSLLLLVRLVIGSASWPWAV